MATGANPRIRMTRVGCFVLFLVFAAAGMVLDFFESLSAPAATETATVTTRDNRHATWTAKPTLTPAPTGTPFSTRTPVPTRVPLPTFSREAFTFGASGVVIAGNAQWRVLSVEFLGDIDEGPNRYVPFNEGPQRTSGNFVLVRTQVKNLTGGYDYVTFDPELITARRGRSGTVASLLSLTHSESDCRGLGLLPGEQVTCSCLYVVPVTEYGLHGIRVGNVGSPAGAEIQTIVFRR